MPKCPKCQKEIDSLSNYCTGITEVYDFTVDQLGEPNYEHVDTIREMTENEWACPECDETLFLREEDAIKFLSPEGYVLNKLEERR